ncbi:hypothetical protein [Pseudomonas sp. QD4]|uniref:hypothetical protein n=1 Tax=Pseudomonas sp. QD4 TaxID=3368618 RepID=UPI003B9E8D89
MQQRLFFNSSKTIVAQMTAIFDFIWPTAAAMWNLRWQVKGLVGENPDIGHDALLGRFVAGSDIRGVNLRRSCLESTWEQQKEQFAKIMLSEFCALYEAWYSSLNEELSGLLPGRKKKDYEYPAILAQIQTMPDSLPLESVIYTVLVQNKKYNQSALPHMITCYRFFKELRNGFIHGGGVAGTNQLNAYKLYASLTAADLGVAEIPEGPVIVAGGIYNVTLRGVVGFGDVVLRLITTLDAELSRKQVAEPVFIKKWKETITNNYTLPADEKEADNLMRRLVGKLNLKAPATALPLKNFLKIHGLVNTF